jgi:diketogulonate reductase-like aldo/keto reductase
MDHPDRARTIDGTRVPKLCYGTAWKEERTEELVTLALRAGFRAIDTANQRKHYHEEGVGRALARVIGEGSIRREELFLQTKFTFEAGQDHRLPYDPSAPIGDQVAQSFASSLAHLAVETIDSYVLHGPSTGRGLAPADIEAWRAMERLREDGRVRFLGVSNVAPDQLEALVARAQVRPTFVQNRCYASRAWDAAVRGICEREEIVYQGFSLLTANDRVVRGATVREIADRHHRTPAQIVFAFALALGMIPLTGTTDPQHMREDLAALDLVLERRELDAIARA